MLTEYAAGKRIHYCREKQDEFSPFKPFRYSGTFPDGEDMEVHTVYCLNREDFAALLSHWTRAGYKYFAVS